MWHIFRKLTGFWGKEVWRPPSKWNARFFFAFTKRYGYLRLGGNWKIPLGRLGKSPPSWLSQGRNFSLKNLPISFKSKVAIAKFIWKMQKKSGIMKSGLDAMHLLLQDDLLRSSKRCPSLIFNYLNKICHLEWHFNQSKENFLAHTKNDAILTSIF